MGLSSSPVRGEDASVAEKGQEMGVRTLEVGIDASD